MTKRLANRLKVLCQFVLVFGNLAIVGLYIVVREAERAEDLPFTLSQAVWLLMLVGLLIGCALVLGMYLSIALGVDVFLLNRVSRIPRGKPFDGLAPGEEERMHLRWTRGALGRGVNAGFKLLLTNKRLLAGSSLTSWYLLEMPLSMIRLVEKLERRWGPPGLRFHMLGPRDLHWDVTLAQQNERARLEDELSRLGIHSTSS